MKRAPQMTRPLAIAALAGAALVMSQPAVAEQEAEPEEAAEEMTKGEKNLAKMLEGREAGEPQRCIRTRPNERLRVIDKTAYVYGSGNTIYVQRTRNPKNIDRQEALVSRRFNATQLCRMDVVTTIDPVLGFFTGAVFFEDFVPYTRIKDADG